MLHRLYHGILDTLGGKDETTYARASQEDVTAGRARQVGEMMATATPRTPGKQWKQIIAGALTGFAAGAGAPPGPGHTMRAAGAGFEGGFQRQRALRSEAMGRADQDFDAEQKQLLNKAQTAHLAAQTTALAWESKRLGLEIDEGVAKNFSAVQGLLQQDPQNHEMATYGGMAEFLQAEPQLHKTISENMPHGMIIPVVGKDGSVTAYAINQLWADRMLAKDQSLSYITGYDGKGEPVRTQVTVPAGSMSNRDYFQTAATKAQADQGAALEAFKARNAEKLGTAQIAEAGQRTGLLKKQLELLPMTQARQEIQSEMDKLYGVSKDLESANDKDLTGESFWQRNKLTPPPAGVAPRKAALDQINTRLKGLQDRADALLKSMAPAAAAPAAAPSPAAAPGPGKGGAASPGGAPAGATMKVPGNDGKLHWSDGKNDLGVVEGQ